MKDVIPAFEIGPIRPPSEASSLLVRVTRNCPWNRCAFCPVYKAEKFSLRTSEEVKRDIDAMARVANAIMELSDGVGDEGRVTGAVLRMVASDPRFPQGSTQVATFLARGGAHVFLQDANSPVMPTDQLVEVLDGLSAAFPAITRVTSYARAHTLVRKKPKELVDLRRSGLNRIHVGLESGSAAVLSLIQKGVTPEQHVDAGLRVKAADMELSEYVMPGLGGKALSHEHALESARVLSNMDPHFIRLRTMAVAPGTELEDLVSQRALEPMDDIEVVREIRELIEALEVTSTLQSDHILNLLSELEGKLPEDKPRLLEVIDSFLSMSREDQEAFIVGRRAGVIGSVWEMGDESAHRRVLQIRDALLSRFGGDLNTAVRYLMARFV